MWNRANSTRWLRNMNRVLATICIVAVYVGSTIPVCLCECICVEKDGCCRDRACCQSLLTETACCSCPETECGSTNSECSDCQYCQQSCRCVVYSFLPPAQPRLTIQKSLVSVSPNWRVYELKPAPVALCEPYLAQATTSRLHAILSVWLN